jgi:hypothetical protein
MKLLENPVSSSAMTSKIMTKDSIPSLVMVVTSQLPLQP